MKFQYNDGGRAKAGFKGSTGDCVVRAIAIATEQPYKIVYEALHTRILEYPNTHRDKLAKKIKNTSGWSSPRGGVNKKIYRQYLSDLGWQWIPTMEIGSGCQVHLVARELPNGILIVRLSRHLTTVIDGVIHDTYNPKRATLICEDGVQRIAHRCVYGYWQEAT